MAGFKSKYKFNVTKPSKDFKFPEKKIPIETILACHQEQSPRMWARHFRKEEPYLYRYEVEDILDDMREDGASFSFDE